VTAEEAKTPRRLDLVGRIALDQQEVAACLGVDARTVRKWMRDEGLPYFRIGGVLRFPLTDLEKWMKERGACEQSMDERVEEVLRDL
jgi:excisionase family DNA binding protein